MPEQDGVGTKYVTKDHQHGLECPRCETDWNELMGTPALRHIGYNPRSGELYQCGICHNRVTEAEIETGDPVGELLHKDALSNFTPKRQTPQEDQP